MDRLIILIFWGVLAASLAGFAARLGWPFENFVHFRLQYIVGLGLVAVWFAVRGRRSWALAAIVLVSANAFAVAPHMGSTPNAPPSDNEWRLSVVHANLFSSQTALTGAAHLAEQKNADIVFLTEADGFSADEIKQAFPNHPYWAVEGAASAVGVLALSRVPLAQVNNYDQQRANIVHLVVCHQAAQRPCVNLFSAHPTAPLPGRIERRNRIIEEMAHLASEAGGISLMLGDMNAAPWAPVMVDFADRSGLARLACGVGGVEATWAAPILPIALPIDHIYLAVPGGRAECTLGPTAGSDHRALAAAIAIPLTDHTAAKAEADVAH